MATVRDKRKANNKLMVHMYIVKNTTIILVFLTIYICTINLLLLFDNTTGMTHLKTIKGRF